MSTPAPQVVLPVPVVLVDDHDMFRAGVRASLDERVAVVGEAATVDEAVAVVHELRPPVVLLDVHLPGGTGGGGAEVVRLCADLVSAGTTRFLARPCARGATRFAGVPAPPTSRPGSGAVGCVLRACGGPPPSG